MASTQNERQIGKQYLREFLPAMLGYVVLLPLAIWLMETIEMGWVRYLIAALPVVPILFALRAMVRHLGRIDELQQRMQLQAFAFAAGATSIVTFTIGLLENAGFPQISLIWVLPMTIAFWGLATAWFSRRYA